MARPLFHHTRRVERRGGHAAHAGWFSTYGTCSALNDVRERRGQKRRGKKSAALGGLLLLLPGLLLLGRELRLVHFPRFFLSLCHGATLPGNAALVEERGAYSRPNLNSDIVRSSSYSC